jgi:hypothetical protein
VLGLGAILFGLATIISGGRVLFGDAAVRSAAGAVVPFVLWFNFAAGFAYVAAGLGLMARKDWAVWLSIVIAAATVLVFAVTRVIFIPQGEYVAYGALSMAAIKAGKYSTPLLSNSNRLPGKKLAADISAAGSKQATLLDRRQGRASGND